MKPHLVPVVDSDPYIYLSGQLAFDSNMQISSTDVAGQTRQIMANIADILKSKGLSLEDIVKTTIWLTSATDFGAFDATYAECLGAHKPARSTVVSELVLPSALIEIEAIARRPINISNTSEA